MRSENENLVQFAHVMSLKLVKLTDCPGYIKNDKKLLEDISSPSLGDNIKAAEIIEQLKAGNGYFTSNQITLPNSIAGKSCSVREREYWSPPTNRENTNDASPTYGNASCDRKGVFSETTKLLRCSRCKNIWYCCKSCQRDDWKRHQRVDCLEVASTTVSAPSIRNTKPSASGTDTKLT